MHTGVSCAYNPSSTLNKNTGKPIPLSCIHSACLIKQLWLSENSHDLTEHVHPAEYPGTHPQKLLMAIPTPTPAVLLEIQLEAGSQECLCWRQQL